MNLYREYNQQSCNVKLTDPMMADLSREEMDEGELVENREETSDDDYSLGSFTKNEGTYHTGA